MPPHVLRHFKKRDPIIFSIATKVIQKAGPIELKASTDYFSDLCESIICQQLSDKAGATIFERFKHLFPNKIITPEFTQQLSNDSIRNVGPSTTKATYIKGLAQKVVNKELDFEKLIDKKDEAIISELTKVKGIGRWTAEMFLLSCLGREDIFSYGDLGIRKALQKYYKFEKEPTKQEAEEIAAKWKPYRTYACRILWRSLNLSLCI